MRTRYPVVALILAAGVIAGCGGSNNSDTANLELPTSQSQTLTYSATTTSTTATSTATAVPTPTSGPLSKEPTITAPKTPAPTKLETKDIVTGTGATAKLGDTVAVNYVGALYTDGKVFDSSWGRHASFSTPLAATSVIQGWVNGIQGMKVGGRRELIIPPALAYKNVAQTSIPANSTLIFIVDLLKVTPAAG
ncbi:MAG TPA: FKBP-type peptidyl-prolyl cis-trans isomerase [Solirubrobacteraceae bacterium]|jgi:peptidylprolyl isomerase